MSKAGLSLSAVFVFALACASVAAAVPVLVPAPQQMTVAGGVYAPPKGGLVPVRMTVPTNEVPPEGYRLSVAADGVKVSASDDAGFFYADETLKQLAGQDAAGRVVYPCVEITDAPRYSWRGLHLDESRHFFGKATVEKLLDQMAAHKLNVLHWHLTDSEGWRLALDRHPELTDAGAWRTNCPLDKTGGKYGPFFYTQDDVRAILAFAKARHIRVMPEIDLPGHSAALLRVHPEFACTGATDGPREVCLGNKDAEKFLAAVLDEVCGLFGSPFVHIGGDECDTRAWTACPRCRARMKDDGLKDVQALQGAFCRGLAEHLAKKGVRAVCWDETSQGVKLPPGAVGMSWRGTAEGAAAAKAGHDVVMTPHYFCYYDYPQGLKDDPCDYPHWGAGPDPITLAQAYRFDPCAGVNENCRGRVLGGQCCNWTEETRSPAELEWKTWPRACAIAEALWTAPTNRDFAAFKARLAAHRARLLAAGVNAAGLDGTENEQDLIIYGGTPAGLAAAVQAARMGRKAVLIDPAPRIGGMATGGLGATDVGNAKSVGGISREFFAAVHARNGGKALKGERDWFFAPSTALAVFEDWVRTNGIAVVRGGRLDRGPGGVVKDGKRIRSIRLTDGRVFPAKMFIDATYEGDLLAAAGVSYTVGREPNVKYGEIYNGVEVRHARYHQLRPGVSGYVKPGDPASGLLPGIDPAPTGTDGAGDRRIQAYCYRMCLTDVPTNRIPFAKPEGYDARDYELLLRNFEAGETELPMTLSRVPVGKTDSNNRLGVSTDFIGADDSYPEASYAERERIARRHRRWQEGLLWTLATNPRVPAKIRAEIGRFGLCKDEFTDNGGWPEQLYVREGRRMVSDTVVTDRDARGLVAAARPVGLASYAMDSHHVRRYLDKDGFVRNEGDVEIEVKQPFPVDYGALVPRKGECANLLVPVCLSASHIAYGSIRMEPVFMILGQSAATAALMAIDAGVAAQDLDYAALRARLAADGQILAWPPEDDAAAELARGFADPPPAARPQTWWDWMDGNVSSNGVTADLEAMAEIGLGGAQIFSLSFGIPAGPVKYNSPAWRAMVRHAAAEAKRLGLELGIHNCAGWSSSGGPWTTPENSMKTVVCAERRVTGPGVFTGILPQPAAQRGFYRDIAVLAFPAVAKGGTVDRAKIVDLTRAMKADGSLDWQIPAGAWTVLRAGYTTNGRLNKWGGPDGTGLECDKLDSAAVTAHWNATMRPLLGALAAGGLSSVLIDSYEVGGQNWTAGLEKVFKDRRGYDLVPFLPSLAGYVVDTKDLTARFDWDFHRVIADLFAENYGGTFNRLARAAGLRFACEGYGGGTFFNDLDYSATADIPMGEFCVGATPWGAFEAATSYQGITRVPASIGHVYGRRIIAAEAFTAWPDAGAWVQDPYALKPMNDKMLTMGVNRMVYHRYAHQPWTYPTRYPGMTMGPFGVQFERTQTWWKQGHDWVTYQARCQFLLQQGTFVADACFYCGEDVRGDVEAALPPGYAFDLFNTPALLSMRVEDGRIVLPSGMSYRLMILPKGQAYSPEVLRALARLVAAGAQIIGPRPPLRAPGLRGYPQADAEVKDLVAALWPAKIRDVSVMEQLATDALAPDCDAGTATYLPFIHRRVGGTDLYFVANSLRESRDVVCTFRAAGRVPELWNPETGRRMRAPVYEVKDGRTVVPLHFESAGSVFVVFSKPGADDHFTRLDVTPAGAVRDGCGDAAGEPVLWAGTAAEAVATTAQGRTLRASAAAVPPPVAVGGPWTLSFPSGWGTPASVTLDRLISWTEHPDPGVRYFSGTAAYRASFRWAGPRRADERYVLDLGDLKNLAEVELNGHPFPVLWKPPFRVDVTDALTAGENAFVVKVTNLWPNRLIGDEQLPPDRDWTGPAPKPVPEFTGRSLKEIPSWVTDGKPSPTGRYTFTTWWHYKKDAKLLPSGLFGPVELRTEKRMEFKP